MATKSYVSYLILGGLVAAIGLFLYYRNSPAPTSAPTTTAPTTTAPTTTAPTTTAPTTTAPATTAPTTVAPTLAPYVPWYSPPQLLPEGLQIVPKSNMSCQQCVSNQQDLRAKLFNNIMSLLELNAQKLEQQFQELNIELRKRGKTDQEIQEQFGFIREKAEKFKEQLQKLYDVDIRGDICGNICPPTCRGCSSKIGIGPPDDFKTQTYNIRFCMNGAEKAREACEVFRNTGVTPSPMMTVPPPQ